MKGRLDVEPQLNRASSTPSHEARPGTWIRARQTPDAQTPYKLGRRRVVDDH